MNMLFAYLPLLGQLLIGFYFTFFGIWSIYHWKPTIDIMVADKIPSPILMMSIGVSCQIILGVMIMCNVQVKLAASLLIILTLVSVFLLHPFWKFKGDKMKLHMTKFIDNLTVTLGALILLLNTINPLNHLSDFLT
jgi:uncharacterized membrane protein YphA (DoxX/SURF4 family)